MGYPTRLLNDQEVIHVDAHPHWSTLASPAFSLVVLTAFTIYTAVTGEIHRAVVHIPLYGLWIAIALFVLIRVARYLTTEFVVTSSRIIDRHGVLSKSSSEIPLERVTNTKLSRNLFERIVGDGDLVVESAGRDGQTVFHDVADPEGVQRLILGLLDAREAPAATSSIPAHPSLAEQLERLAALHAAGSLTDAEFVAAKAALVQPRD